LGRDSYLNSARNISSKIISDLFPEESSYFQNYWEIIKGYLDKWKDITPDEWPFDESQKRLSQRLGFADVSELLAINSPKILFIISAVLVKISEEYKFSINKENKELLSIIEKYGHKFNASPPLIRHLKDKLPGLIDLRNLAECQIMKRVKGDTNFSYVLESETNQLLEAYKNDKEINVILDKTSNNLYVKGTFVRKLGKVRLAFISCLLESKEDVCAYETIAYRVWNEKELDDTHQMKKFKDKLFHQVKNFSNMAEYLGNAIEIEEGKGIRIGEGLRNCIIISWKKEKKVDDLSK
jgi:hypothetical protein